MNFKRIGFLGGTFDPIHCGHLNLGLEIAERHELDMVFFCPAAHAPGKEEPKASIFHRLKMTALAIEPISVFSLNELEANREGLSYTIDTIRELKISHPKALFHLILGEDLLHGLPDWKEEVALLQLAPPFIGTRHQRVPSSLSLPSSILKKMQEGLTIIPLLDISSSQIRLRLKEKKYCGHLLPAKVLDYIRHHHLYC